MRSATRYGIVANPASGAMPMDRRIALLRQIGALFSAKLWGLDTGSAQELVRCACEASERCDVLVVAGGDGTFSLVLNAVDLSKTTLAFLPFGTGNALTHALGYRGGLFTVAERIRNSAVTCCDLIDCGGRKKAFMVSLGVDAEAIRLYERYRAHGRSGLQAHVPAAFHAVVRHFRPTACRLWVDGRYEETASLWSLMVVKQPFFGMGLKAVPGARWEDGFLHIKLLTAGIPEILAGLLTGFTIGNQVGRNHKAKKLFVRLDDPLPLQIDGELGWSANRYSFAVLPRILRLKA